VHEFVNKIIKNAFEENVFEETALHSLQKPAELYVFPKELISKTRDPVIPRDQLIKILLLDVCFHEHCELAG
jgi:hypothetical protein